MGLLDEELMHPVDAIQQVTGKRLHYATAFKWMNYGLLKPDGNRVRLEYVKAGAGRLTSVPAVLRLIAEQTGGVSTSTISHSNRESHSVEGWDDCE